MPQIASSLNPYKTALTRTVSGIGPVELESDVLEVPFPLTHEVSSPAWTEKDEDVALAPVLSNQRTTIPFSTKSGVQGKGVFQISMNGNSTGTSMCPVGMRIDSVYGGVPPPHAKEYGRQSVNVEGGGSIAYF